MKRNVKVVFRKISTIKTERGKTMLIEEVNQLLDRGYQSIETGYFRLPNGQMHVRVLTRMPGCKGKMVDWWFGYLDGTETYKKWHPKAHMSLEWDQHWKPGHYIGASHTIEENMGGSVLKVRIRFHDPSEFFDISRFEEANVGAVICGKAYNPDESPNGMVIHFVRDTDYGCAMRSRFWLFGAPDMAGAGLMRHCIEEMGTLADFLPNLYGKQTGSK
ncbi:MAG: hypothetical protein JRF46_00225 [Deltaproteobacteria bacterium]|nr:hypothetical protein [Deltaproteobacteria bacterium]RLB80973.1 MAG: hypothetical protein DRH17_10535 [Deltaproteobacteria bacterium]